MEELEIFISSEQPTTCPQCGTRTELIEDFEISQEHRCISEDCKFQFMLEFDN